MSNIITLHFATPDKKIFFIATLRCNKKVKNYASNILIYWYKKITEYVKENEGEFFDSEHLFSTLENLIRQKFSLSFDQMEIEYAFGYNNTLYIGKNAETYLLTQEEYMFLHQNFKGDLDSLIQELKFLKEMNSI